MATLTLEPPSAPGGSGPLALGPILDEIIDHRFGEFAHLAQGVTIGGLGKHHLMALEGDLFLPSTLLKRDAIEHNVAAMSAYCREHAVSFAPHGKTTMAPQLIDLQLRAGAWGVSAATIPQARVLRGFGANRVLLANQIVERRALEWVATELADDPTFEFACLVDDPRTVSLMDAALRPGRWPRPLDVLVEIGVPGGRAGCRTAGDALAVAAAASAASNLRLVGIETYEGMAGRDASQTALAAIDALLKTTRDLCAEFADRGLFEEADEVWISAGGSAYFDRVVAAFASNGVRPRPRVILRSGCYVTHDSIKYHDLSPLDGRGVNVGAHERLRPAIETWAPVLSRPEPDLVIAGFGRRDVPFDAHMPTPERLKSPSEQQMRSVDGWRVEKLMDQHAFIHVPMDAEVLPGDLVGVGISHPCGSFDRRRLIPVVDEHYEVVGAIQTFF